MKELLYEILKEARTGNVIIDGEEWPISFNSHIEEENKTILHLENEKNNAILIVKREKEFLDLLEEYLSIELLKNRDHPFFFREKERNTKKWLLSYLFVNFTTEEFLNPIETIRRRIEFLKDNTFDSLHLEIPISSMDSTFCMENKLAHTCMETPNKMEFSIRKGDYKYPLPTIYYGICEEKHKKVCYIYSMIQNNKKEQLTTEEMYYRSKINRKLFGINSDVKDLEDFHSEEESNIRDVSMSFVYALNSFITLLQKKGMEEIKVVSYLPLRYQSRDSIARSQHREDLEERNNDIQRNLTNKLIRTFRRLSVQNKDLEIISYPYENDEYLTLKLDKKTKELDNMLLEEVSERVTSAITK